MADASEIHASFTGPLLGWYDRHARVLPWRLGPERTTRGERPDPYRVWLSEIMLQQTTVKAVIPYFLAFCDRWPDVKALAAADDDAVMAAWAGLGYYSRARNLLACARAVADGHGGHFPASASALRALPGIGDYTSSAIAAIAFGEAVPVIDGNVERVALRFMADGTPLPAGKTVVRCFLSKALSQGRPGDFAQAMMDLGATICTPKRPACALCPVRDGCAGLVSGDPAAYPVKPPKTAKPVRIGAAFVALDDAGRVLLEKRPAKGLLGGMAQVPTTDWSSRQDGATGMDAAPFPARWQDAGIVEHVFTHFTLRLQVHFAVGVPAERAAGGRWWSAPGATEALPNLFAKAIALARTRLEDQA